MEEQKEFIERVYQKLSIYGNAGTLSREMGLILHNLLAIEPDSDAEVDNMILGLEEVKKELARIYKRG